MRLEVRDLRLTVALGEFRTLTEAAKHLNLTPSALSHQLADLERRIGAPLFERAGRRLIATQLGASVCTRSREALDGVELLEREIAEEITGRRSWLRIGADCYTSFGWLPPVMEAFGAVHPSVEVTIVPEVTRDAVGALLRGETDLAIMSNPVRDRRVRTQRLLDDELVLVVSARHRLANRASIEPHELKGERFLGYSPAETNNLFKRIFMPAGVSPKQLRVLQITEAILEMTRANMGVTVLARWAVQPHLEEGRLKAVRIEHESARRTWRAATRASRTTPRYVEDFIRFLAATLATPPRTKPEFGVVRTLKRLSPQRGRKRSA
jgi:LysR family transcriptional regulator for metE and metH